MPSVLADNLEGELLDVDVGHLQGNIIHPDVEAISGDKVSHVYDTLDEPILTSIVRDLKAVGQKFFFVLLPSTNNILMREWDLWGPLFLCIYIGLLLQGMSKQPDSNRFTVMFLVIWIGTTVVTYNTVFVQKATISVFQCVCVIGYCLVPVALAVSIFELLHIIEVATDEILLRLLLIAGSVSWASFACIKILKPSTEEDKKVIVLGPIVIFYVTMGLIIALYTYSDS